MGEAAELPKWSGFFGGMILSRGTILGAAEASGSGSSCSRESFNLQWQWVEKTSSFWCSNLEIGNWNEVYEEPRFDLLWWAPQVSLKRYWSFFSSKGVSSFSVTSGSGSGSGSGKGVWSDVLARHWNRMSFIKTLWLGKSIASFPLSGMKSLSSTYPNRMTQHQKVIS